MIQKLSPWLAAGLTTGLVVILGLWLIGFIFLNTFILGQRSAIDQKLATAVVQASLNNPEIQAALKNQVILYLKSPEGKAKLVELIQSPEMVRAMSENLQSPEMRASVLKLMEVPEFRTAVLKALKDAPEMKILSLLSSAVILEPAANGSKPAPTGSAQ